jgi:adenylate cyclase
MLRRVGLLLSIADWIGANEAVLSGIAAAIVILGVLLTPLGRGLWALLRPRPNGAVDGATAAPEPLPRVTDRPSIAVMPFANLSGDPEHEYLADGLTEDIITGLSRVKQFFVIARNSTFTYKGRPVDVQQVSRELGVRYVLEGSVRKLGDRIRVTAQLIDAKTRGHAWAERFDRKLAEILEVDDEVTEAIVAALQPALRRAEAEHARRAAPEDLNAWALVNRAWVAVQSDLGSTEVAESAIRGCREALAIDPDYAFAHAVLGHATSLLLHRPGCDASAEEALASLRTALSLAPDDPLVHHCHAALLGNLGRTPDAARAWERALALDPNSAGARAGLGIARIFLKQPESALDNIDAALRLSPRDPITYHWLAHRALACIVLGRWQEAVEAAQESVQRTGSRIGYATLAAALAHLGRLEEARAAYAQLELRIDGLDAKVLRTLVTQVAPDPESERLLGEALELAAGQSGGFAG